MNAVRRHLSLILTTSLFILLSAAACPGQVSEMYPVTDGPKNFYVAGLMGVTIPKLTDVNDYITAYEAELAPVESDAIAWDDFGPEIDLGLEVGKYLSETLSVGLRFLYQRGVLYNGIDNVPYTWNYQPSYKLFDLSARVKISLGPTGAFYGAGVGYAWTQFEELLTYEQFSDPTASYILEGEFDGAGLSAQVFGGYEGRINNGMSYVGEIGYRHRKIGKLDGEVREPLAADPQPYSGQMLDLAGDPLDFDFSGLYLLGGIEFHFGRRP